MNIFISRELSSQSPFLCEFQNHITHFSLLEFSAVRFQDVPASDFIFFYSKNAVHFFLSQLSVFPSDVAYACMGKGTLAALEQKGLKATFVGQGTPNEVAQQFLAVTQSKKVLFPRAETSRRSIQNILGDRIEGIDLVVYKNVPKTNFPKPSADILIFTSPLNAKTYFDTFTYKGEKVLSIGSSTTAALTALDIPNILQAKYPSEASLLELVKNFNLY